MCFRASKSKTKTSIPTIPSNFMHKRLRRKLNLSKQRKHHGGGRGAGHLNAGPALWGSVVSYEMQGQHLQTEKKVHVAANSRFVAAISAVDFVIYVIANFRKHFTVSLDMQPSYSYFLVFMNNFEVVQNMNMTFGKIDVKKFSLYTFWKEFFRNDLCQIWYEQDPDHHNSNQIQIATEELTLKSFNQIKTDEVHFAESHTQNGTFIKVFHMPAWFLRIPTTKTLNIKEARKSNSTKNWQSNAKWL